MYHFNGSKILEKYKTILMDVDPVRPMGQVLDVSGMSIISEGPPDVSVGEICKIQIERDKYLACEIAGFEKNRLILMPIGSTMGVHPNAPVFATGKRLSISVGNDMLGRVLNGIGQPLDDKSPIISGERRYAEGDPPGATKRIPIRTPLETGIRAIDGLLTVGRGQRLGIFAGTGVGKSTMLGMIARYTRADVNVICLVGERGREVREFIENDLGEEGLQRSVIVVSTNDRSAMEKVYAPGFAMSIAEYFRDQGLTVNLLMDSITRYCMALREVGIAAGEQLGPGGYPPGVWYRLSRLVERSGALMHGSITGFFSILVEADDMNDPVADAARGLLDGHIVLARRLAHKSHYPAIEVTESISRVMDRVIERDHLDDALRIKTLLAAYRENEDVINLGAYAKGSNPDVDEAIAKMPAINKFLRQRIEESTRLKDSVRELKAIARRGEEEDYY
jgi:flagellum-specific ATP synthase